MNTRRTSTDRCRMGFGVVGAWVVAVMVCGVAHVRAGGGSGQAVAAAPVLLAQPAQAKSHPYMFFERDELDAIRRRFKHPPQSYYLEALVRQADRGGRGDAGVQLWAYLLTGEQRYRDKAMAWVRGEWDRKDFGEEWIGFKVATMAQMYDTLHPGLSDDEKAKMRGYLERALDAHLKKMGSWFYNNPSNTVPAQGGAAGMAALALLFESPKAPDAVAATRKKLLRYAQRCFAEDGGYIEGTLYWAFGVSFYLGFAHADHNATGNDDLLTAKNLLKQHRFAETILGGDGQFMPFNDSQPWLNAWGVCIDLGKRGDSDLLLWLADHMAAVTAGKRPAGDVDVDMAHSYPPWPWILMTQAEPGPARRADRPFPGVPTLSVLEKMQWGVMRSSGDYIPQLVVGVKGSGGQLSHHGQKDLGSFMLYAHGEMLLLDPGYFNGGPDCHSLPLIDGHGPGKSGSKIVAAHDQRHWRAMVVDSARGYGKAAERVRRTLVMQGHSAVIVLDDIIPTGEGRITAQYQAAHATTVDDQGDALIAGRQATLGLFTFGPELELSARKRSFGRSWGFVRLAKKGRLAWHSLTGDYAADPANPLVSVLVAVESGRKPPRPSYQREGDRITVVVPGGGGKVEFVRVEGQWALARAAGADDDREAGPAEPKVVDSEQSRQERAQALRAWEQAEAQAEAVSAELKALEASHPEMVEYIQIQKKLQMYEAARDNEDVRQIVAELEARLADIGPIDDYDLARFQEKRQSRVSQLRRARAQAAQLHRAYRELGG